MKNEDWKTDGVDAGNEERTLRGLAATLTI